MLIAICVAALVAVGSLGMFFKFVPKRMVRHYEWAWGLILAALNVFVISTIVALWASNWALDIRTSGIDSWWMSDAVVLWTMVQLPVLILALTAVAVAKEVRDYLNRWEERQPLASETRVKYSKGWPVATPDNVLDRYNRIREARKSGHPPRYRLPSKVW